MLSTKQVAKINHNQWIMRPHALENLIYSTNTSGEIYKRVTRKDGSTFLNRQKR